MKITVQEGWSGKSKMAIVAMTISLITIVTVILFD
jgi:hypothetical protein